MLLHASACLLNFLQHQLHTQVGSMSGSRKLDSPAAALRLVQTPVYVPKPVAAKGKSHPHPLLRVAGAVAKAMEENDD
jgi:hypothetical protein